MPKTKDITVRVPVRVAAQVSRFLEEQEATTLEVFLAARIADMAVGLRSSKEPDIDETERLEAEVTGYL